MKTLYRVEIYNETTGWCPVGCARTREEAIALAAKRSGIKRTRVVEFTAVLALTKKGATVVLDEQGRVVLDADGKAGPFYRTDRVPDRTPREETAALQRQLVQSGYLKPSDVDGLRGPRTEQALEASQREPIEPEDPIDAALSNFHRKQQGKT